MKLSIVAGTTSQSVNIFIQDSSSTTGAGLTGLAFNTASLVAYYTHSGTNTTATAITLATLAAVTSAYSSGGFKEIDATNMPGWYRFDPPNACLATSKGRVVSIHLKGATNMAPCPLEVELTGWDNQSTTDGGLSKLTSLTFTVAAKLDANVYTWNGTAVSSPATAGIPEVNIKNVNNVSASSVTTISANVGTTQPVNFTGTGASALAKSDMVDIAGAAVSTSTAQIGVNVVNAGATAWNSGAIGASTLASSTITAAKFATDAIDSNALAASAVTEIQSGLATSSALSTVQADTDDIQTRIPAALGANGNMKSDVRDLLGTAWLPPAVAGTPDVNTKTFLSTLDFTAAMKAATLARVTLVDTVTALTGLTASDVGAIKTKTDFLPSFTAGAAGGVLIAGSNAPTTFAGSTSTAGLTITGGTTATGALKITGGSSSGAAVLMTTTNGDGINITVNSGKNSLAFTGGAYILGNSGANEPALYLAGDTGGAGLYCVGGSTGSGITGIAGGGSNSHGMTLGGQGGGHGLNLSGGSTGNGLTSTGGTTGHGISAVGQGSSKHGMLITGGSAGTSDGLKLVSGTGGVGFRLDTLTTSGTVTFNSFAPNFASAADFSSTMKTSLGTANDSSLATYDAPTHTELTAELATADDATLAAIAALPTSTAIRNAITGGAYALDTDSNGRIRIVDGTAAGELDTSSGLVSVVASSVRSAVGLASANLDTQFGDLPTANENATALLDLADGVETGVTFRQSQRAMAAVLCGKIADAGTGTETYKSIGGTTTRVTGTIDASGNRSVMLLSL